MTAILSNKKDSPNKIQTPFNRGFMDKCISLLAENVRFLALMIIFALLNIESNGFAAMNIQLNIKETLGISRSKEMVHNGIPIAKSENIKDTTSLVIENSEGTKIPAAFEVLSRWAGGKDDASKEIQWLLVSFPATVSANSTAYYHLKTGTPVVPSVKITVTDNQNDYTVDTGSAKFVISKNSLSLFDSISLSDSGPIVSDGGSAILQNNGGGNSKIKGQPSAPANAPSVTIERNNDHYVCIKAEGDYANTPIGDKNSKPLSYKIRYEFFAGSPTVVVYHKFYWPGRNGSISRGDPITLDNVSLILPDMSDYSFTEVYADSLTFYTGALTSSKTASVKQNLRTVFANTHIAQVEHGTNSQTTTFASQPMLINRSVNGDIAVSIDHMQYFEPQSIETDHSGKITVNVMAENQIFSNYQGAWTRVGISAMPSGASYENAVSENFAPLNHRLFAFPDNTYIRTSNVFMEIPQTPNNSSVQDLKYYYDKLKEVTATTRSWFAKEKYQGLMTWGALTRYSTENGSGTGWDKVYSGAFLTDYHNAWNNVTFQYLLEGDPTILYDLSFMGARRMLHTQIIQPDAEHSDPYMGWGYSGYNRYRSDGNSCHSYFDNLYNYYYMTGDMEVIDILKVGGAIKSEWSTRDGEGNLNDQDSGGKSWINYINRPGSQTTSLFNFLGHVDDSKYLEDFRHMFNHAFSRHIVLLSNGDGREYGFISTDTDEVSSGFVTEQFWMASLYFMHSLYTLYHEWGDLELGSSNLKISRVYEAVANTYMEYVAKLGDDNDGTWNGSWFNRFQVYYSGNKIGGTITSLHEYGTSPIIMYNSGKAPIVTVLLRAGALSGNSKLSTFGMQGLKYILDYEEFIESGKYPWGKISGIIYTRMHHGMSYLGSDGTVDKFLAPKNLKIIDQGQ